MTGDSRARVIEEASLRAWPALEEAELYGWTLRCSEGFTGRANSVQALGEPSLPLEELVSSCESWYAERGRPNLFRLSRLSTPGLDAFLESRGYDRFNRTLVLTRDAAGLDPERDDVELEERHLHDWLRAYAGFTGLPAAPSPMGRIIERIGGGVSLAQLWLTSPRTPVACGLAVADGLFLGLFDLVVSPDHRRRGFGTELVRRLVAWGTGQGASTAYLQVTEDNEPALRLYRRLGFSVAYDYWYRVGAAPDPSPTGADGVQA